MKRLLRNWLGIKESQARIAWTVNQVGQPQNSPKNYQSYYGRGYQNNVVAYRCVSLISRACAGIDWDVFNKRKGVDPVELPDHPLKKLMEAPNPLQARSQFIEAMVAYYQLTGNTFVEAVGPSQKSPPMELWSVRPDAMKIIPDAKGYPSRYEFTMNNVTKRWDVNPVTLKAMILQVKTFHPTNAWWGMSPLEAAMVALDQNNAGQQWNLALLQNGASPSGILSVKQTDVNPGGVLTEPQWTMLRQELDDAYSGPANAGRPMVLEGGLGWEQIGLGPRDMEFLKAKEVTAIDVCQVFGVPPEMLGLGQKTFNNYKEARLSFYEDTVLPLMDLLATEFNSWLCPMFGDGISLVYDKDDIEALQIKREVRFAALKDANFLTLNEKREAAGYEPADGGDVFIINNEVVQNPESVAADLAEPEETEPEDPPEPPNPDDEDENAADLDEAEEDDEDQEKSFKAFNLLNANERRKSWKNQNWRKTRLERPFERDLGSDFKELASDLSRAIKSSTDPRTQEFALLKAIDDNMPVIEKTMKRHIGYSVDDFGSAIFSQSKSLKIGVTETKARKQWDDWAKRYIDRRSAKAIGEIAGTTKKKVQQIVKRLVQDAIIDGTTNTDLANELQDEFASLSKARARTIARTEVQMASNNASIEAVKSLEIPGMVKEWISAKDDRVRTLDNTNGHADHEAMDGVETTLDEKFTVPPDTSMDGPGDPSAPPEQVINCRCALGFKSRNNGEL